MNDNKARQLTLLLSACLFAAGCTHVTVTEPDGQRVSRSSAEFRDYVADVFRLQNQVMDQLITDYSLEDGGDDLERDRAEQHMVEACRDLNDVAVAIGEGRSVSLVSKRRLVKSITACDYAARDLDTLLNPGTERLAESY